MIRARIQKKSVALYTGRKSKEETSWDMGEAGAAVGIPQLHC